MHRGISASFIFILGLAAQDYRAKLQGLVTDTTQAVVPDASVTPWYKPYLKDMPAIYYPNLDIGGGFGKYGYWTQHPRNWSAHASMRKSAGRSQWKSGVEGRWHRSWGIHHLFTHRRALEISFRPPYHRVRPDS